MIIDIRAGEISRLRENTRDLTAMLAEIEQTARANDRILLTLHKLSLLLIKRNASWQTTATALLKKNFALLHCDLLVFPARQAAPAAVARLPAGGRGMDKPLAGVNAVRGARRYFYLPLKKGRRVAGLLVFASGKAGAFPDDAARDFTRRIAEMLAAAL